MKKVVKKKNVIRFYCNMFYFYMIFSIFSTPYHASFNESPKVSLSSIEDQHSVKSIIKLPDIDFKIDDYIPVTDNITTSSVSDLEYANSYSGMNLDYELEDGIKELAEQYEVPYQIVLTIGEQESRGSWNNNGVISPTNDYGEFQINECNLSYIEENLGYTKEEIRYDSLKNAEACVFLLKDILSRDDVNSLEDVFGMYNGWINWQNKPISVSYVDGCLDIMDKYFSDYHYPEEYTLTKR